MSRRGTGNLLGPRHKTVNSVDTNVSAMAESTISIGQLSKFPEPPSTPNSPASSVFTAHAVSHTPPTVPIRPLVPRKLPPPVSYVDPSPSLTQSHQPGNAPDAIPSSSKASSSPAPSNTLSAYDWHDGASSIDVDGGNGRLLPTSFITSLLQENKIKRASGATSGALSGFSEATYPPVAYRSNASEALSPLPSSRLIDAFSDPELDPPSPDSNNLKLVGSDGTTGDAPRRLSTSRLSTVSESSMQSYHTLRSGERLLQKNPYTTYESDNLKEFGGSAHRPDFLNHDPMASSRRPRNSNEDLARSTSVHSSRSAKTFLSNLSLSLRQVFVGKAKPLPPMPRISGIPLHQEQAYQELDMSSPLPDLINRAGVLRAMLDNGQRPHSSGSFQVVLPLDVHQTGDLKSEAQMYSRDLPNIPDSPWYKKYWRFLLIVVGLVILTIIGLTVGLLVGLRKPDQHKCSENMVGSACNISKNRSTFYSHS